MSSADDRTLTASGAPAEPDAAAPETGARVGRYVLAERIGAGGMGVVFRAHDPTLARDLAIKVVRAHRDDEVAKGRLLREARALARLTHPNVVPIFDVGETDDGVYLVMPYLPGGTLRVWLRGGPRRWPQVVARFVSAGRGLAAAHDAGMIHRDFKPDNVLLGGRGEVQVADFGLARGGGEADDAHPAAPLATVDSGELTRTGDVLGTPAYMAPEQMVSEAVDARADQFAFCVALYEAVYGRRPFDVARADAAPLASLHAEIVAGRVLPPPADSRAPAWLHPILRRGLAATPADRWPSMTALVDQIERRTAAEPDAVTSSESGIRYGLETADTTASAQLVTARPRRRAAAVAAAVAAAASIAGTIALCRGGAAPAPRDGAPAADAGPTAGAVDLATARALTSYGADGCAYAPAFADAHTLVFDLARGTTDDVYRISVDGGAPVQLTTAPSWEWRAHAGRHPGEVVHLITPTDAPTGAAIAYLDVATGAETTAFEAVASDVVVGDGVVYYTAREGTELRRRVADRDELVLTTSTEQRIGDLALSPRGDVLAFTGPDVGAAYRLCLLGVHDDAPRCAPGATRGRPAFSSDGATVLYPSDAGVRRRDVATGADALWLPDVDARGGLAVAPDGGALAWSTCGPTQRLFDVTADAGRPVIEGDAVGEPAFGPRGELAWTQPERGVDVLMLRDAAGVIKQLTSPALGPVASPTFDATGGRLAFAVGGARAGIYVMQSVISVPTAVTHDAGDTLPTWLGDDIAFARYNANSQFPEAYLVDSDGGTPRRVGTSARAVFGVDPGRRALLLASQRALSWWDPRTGRERPGPRPPADMDAISMVAISPHARWIAYQIGPAGQNVWRAPLDGSAPPAQVYTAPGPLPRVAIDDDGHVLAAPQVFVGDLHLVRAEAGTRL